MSLVELGLTQCHMKREMALFSESDVNGTASK
jgi:hypothetical protein